LTQRRLHPKHADVLKLASVWLVGVCNGRPGRDEFYILEQWHYTSSVPKARTVRRYLLSVRSSLNGELLRQTMVNMPHMNPGTRVDSMFVTADGVLTGLTHATAASASYCCQFTLTEDWKLLTWRQINVDQEACHQATLLLSYPENREGGPVVAMVNVGEVAAHLELLV
jgi:hypothetical protein